MRLTELPECLESFPSGDSAGAGAFGFSAYLFTGEPLWLLGVNAILSRHCSVGPLLHASSRTLLSFTQTLVRLLETPWFEVWLASLSLSLSLSLYSYSDGSRHVWESVHARAPPARRRGWGFNWAGTLLY